MKRAVILAVIAFTCCAGSAMAFDFSADVVSTVKGRSFTGKIYVSGDRVRMDMAGAMTITRMDKKIAWIVMPDQDMYLEQPIDLEKVAGATEKMPGEVERTLIGPDTVDGKNVNKYRVKYKSAEMDETVLQWVEPRTNIPIKTAALDDSWSVEYKNLNTGPQANDLFEIPAGYKKFAMPNMQDMMRSVGRS